ncbi:MAG: alpha/beta fold hydrolase [Puniceicoccaceae bacterium]
MNQLPPRLEVLYPFSQNRFESPEGVLNYVDEGEGEAVVMIHGNPTWSFFYRNLVLDLRDTFRCLALDNLGCGLSEKPQKGDYTLAGHISRTCDWIESLGLESFHLVVHDWGGPIGLGMADKFSDRVKSITLMNTAAFEFPSLPGRIAVCRIPLLGALLVRGLNGFAKGATQMTTVQPLAEAVQEGYLYPYKSWHDRVAIHRFVKDIPMNKSHVSWETLKDLEHSLEKWRHAPVRILWGSQDWCFHERILRVWESILPDADVQRFTEAGHYLMEDAGDAIIAEVRRFLTN